MASLELRRLNWILGVTLAVGTLAIYGRVIGFDFTTYDDPVYVTENPHVQRGLTVDTFIWAFTTGHGGNWHPLTWLSHALDCQLYGLKAGGHHLTSLLLHLANTLLLFSLLRRLTAAPWRSAVVAALFAWHPLHVESVAWVAERKDVLSALFWFLAIGQYARCAETGERRRYFYALLCFALGLLAKPMVVTLPFVLLLLDYWPLRRQAPPGPAVAGRITSNAGQCWQTWRPLVTEKWPFFLLAGASCLVTFLAQKSGGAVLMLDEVPLTDRAVNAVIAYVEYLRKMIWPANLVVFYPFPHSRQAAELIGAAAVLMVATAGVFLRRRRQPCLLVGWFWYVGTLVPVIGLVQVGLQAMADRYTYLPLIGIFIALTWSVADSAAHGSARLRWALRPVTGLVLALCLVLTWIQVGMWRDTVTLFTHALEAGPDRFVAHNQLARALGKLGHMDEAEAQFKAALRLRPGAPEPLYNLGLIAARRGDLQSASERYQQALQTQPGYVPARFEVANILANQGKLQEAAAEYRQCVRAAPGVAEIHRNLGLVLVELGALQEAANQFRAALRAEPKQAELHDQLGSTLEKLGELNRAQQHYTEAVRLQPALIHARLKLGLLLARQARFGQASEHLLAVLRLAPTNPAAHYNLAAIHAAQGRLDEAMASFAEVVRLTPADADARGRLALLFVQARRFEAAIAQYREGLGLQPDWVEGLRGLAWILATNPRADLRDPLEGRRLAERAAELTHRQSPAVLAVLAAACAEAGEFAAAIATAEEAQQAALTGRQTNLVQQLAQQLESYRAGKAWRE